MKTKRLKKLVTGLLAVALIFNLGIVALAAQHTEYPLGGTWNWGERKEGSIKYAYSDYLLSYNKNENTNGTHKTTVTGRTTNTSDWISSGKWAKSKVRCRWPEVERCYYNAQDLNGSARG